MEGHEKTFDEFTEDSKNIIETHQENAKLWAEFLVNFQSAQNLTDGVRK